MSIALGTISHSPDDAPATCAEVTGDDLRELLDAYVAACSRDDLVAAIVAVRTLETLAAAHTSARIVETEGTAVTWADIGAPFGMTAWDAANEFGGMGEGPRDWPD